MLGEHKQHNKNGKDLPSAPPGGKKRGLGKPEAPDNGSEPAAEPSAKRSKAVAKAKAKGKASKLKKK